MEQPEDIHPVVDQRNVRPRFEGPSQEAPGNERFDHVTPVINLRDPLGGQHSEGSPSSSPPPQLPRNAGPNSDSLSTPFQATAPPRTDPEPTPTLIDVNPESGSTTGGARIWLKGQNFPTLISLFARFGTAVVSTVSPMEIPFDPYLIRFLRISPLAPFFPVGCLPQPCQVSSMLRSQRIPSQIRQSMGPVSQHFST
jgi:hypothetical protein